MTSCKLFCHADGGPLKLSAWRVFGDTEALMSLLWILAIVLVVLWLLGYLAFSVGSSLIHLLLVIALIVLIYQLVTGRRSV
jgi:hypothetical protein